MKPEAPLPELEATETKVDRLKRERERLGGVNLRAEEEAREIETRLETILSEREGPGGGDPTIAPGHQHAQPRGPRAAD